MRVDQFRPLIGHGYFRPLQVQLADQARPQPFLLVLRFFLQRADRIFVYLDLRPVQERLIKRDPRLHRDPIRRFLKVVIGLLNLQAGDRHPVRRRSAGIHVFQDTHRSIVIFLAQPCVRLVLPFVEQSGRDERRQIAGPRFDQTAMGGFQLLARDRDLGVLRLGERDRLLDVIRRHAPLEKGWPNQQDRHCNGPKRQAHSVFISSPRLPFSIKIPSSAYGYISSCKLPRL